MIAVRPARDGMPACWQLIHRSGAVDGGVLATAPILGPDRPGWQEAVRRLRNGEGAVSVSPAADGRFGWSLTGPAGELIAQSPPVYDDQGSCRHAFLLARRAARTVIGGDVPCSTPMPVAESSGLLI